MSQQPMPPTNQPAAPHASETTTHTSETTEGARPSSRHRFDNVSDKRIVSMLRQWVEDAEKDLATHSYFPTLARAFFQILGDEAIREERREAQDAERRAPKNYEIQPVGIPDLAEVTLDTDDTYRVFSTLLDAIKVWDCSEKPLEDYAARARLDDLLDAVKIMNAGYMAAIEPGIQAHRDDEAAARAWTHDRWMARSRLEQEARAARVAQERQRDEQDDTDHPATATTPATAAAPPSARDTRSA